MKEQNFKSVNNLKTFETKKEKKELNSKYNLEQQKEKYKVLGHKFPDGYAIAIRQPIDFDLLKEEYPAAEMPKNITEDSIALDWRFAPNEDGTITQGVQLTIRTLNGTGVAELEKFEAQSIQYIMDMDKFEELFKAMKKIKKNARPDLEAYEKQQKQHAKDLKAYQERMGQMISKHDTRKEVAERITDTILASVEDGNDV